MARVSRAEDCYRCTVQRRGRTAEIMLAGELDLAAARATHDATEGALDTVDPRGADSPAAQTRVSAKTEAIAAAPTAVHAT